MGVILQVALRPLVLGAGRLQRGAARAGARPRHGMCAEQADLATRLHHRHGRATSRKTTVLRESRKIPGLDRRHERRSVDLVCCDQLS